MKPFLFFSWVLIFGALAGVSRAQVDGPSAAPSGGATLIPLYGQSDNFISVPFNPPILATFQVSAVGQGFLILSTAGGVLEGFPGEGVTFDVRGLYFVEFKTGNLQGVRYPVIGYSNRNLFLDTQGDDLRNHPAGTIAIDEQICIFRHWTLGRVFGETVDELVIEASPTSFAIRDLVLVPENQRIGVNKTPVSYYFRAGHGWRRIGDPTTDQKDVVIEPGQGLIVRKRSAGDVELVSFGDNGVFRFATYVQGGDGVSGNDVLLGIRHPEVITLAQANLTAPGPDGVPTLRPSPSLLQVLDRLFIYQPGVATPAGYFFVTGLGWRDATGQEVDPAQILLVPGQAFFVRKSATSASTDWFLEIQ